MKFHTAWGKSSRSVSRNIRLISDNGNDADAVPADAAPGAEKGIGLAGDQPGQVLAPFTPVSKFIFTRYLREGMSGEDVRQLQIFLNRSGFILAGLGYGSPGHETAYFGRATRQALIRFQRKHDLRPYLGKAGPSILKLLNSLS